jgi:hypothetical protein
MAGPTLGAMIAAMGSPAEWGPIHPTKLSWDDSGGALAAGQLTDVSQKFFSFSPANTVNGKFNFSMGTNGVWPGSSRQNKVFSWGYNQKHDSTPEKAGEPTLAWFIEAFYAPSVGNEFIETYIQYIDSAGTGVFRPIMFSINRNTKQTDSLINATHLQFFNPVTGNQYLSFADYAITLYSGLQIYSDTNNTYPFLQKNAAGDNFIAPFKINASNEVEFGTYGRFPVGLIVLTSVDYEVPSLKLFNDNSSGHFLRGGNSGYYYDFNRSTSTGFLNIVGSQAGYTGYALMGGPLGVDISPPANQKFTVKGYGTTNATAAIVAQASDLSVNFYVSDDGSGWLRNGPWTYSDKKNKENVKALNAGSAEKIKALKPIKFDHKGDGPKECLGFMAEDVQSIIPEAVAVNPHGESGELMFCPTYLLPHVVQSIQEVIDRLEKLESKK